MHDIKVILIEPAFVISDFHNNAKIVVIGRLRRPRQ
jgi:hypothetical protein